MEINSNLFSRFPPLHQHEDVSERMFIPIRMVVSSFNPLDKICSSQIGSFRQCLGWNKKYLKALPSDSFRSIRKWFYVRKCTALTSFVLSIKMGASDVKWLDMCLSLGNCKNVLASPVTSQGEHISWTPLVGPKVMKSTMAKLIQVCLVSGLKVVAFGPRLWNFKV